jgi:uracil-DNA glycosylase family 4
MGFFHVEGKKADKNLKGLSPEFLRRHECSVCPLDRVANAHPKMEPTGSKKPAILIIGEAPGRTEDERGKQFVGKAGKVLRDRIPPEWGDQLRWTNAVNCRPPDNRTPETIELNCCKPRLERDVDATKPKAVFGFGAVPLFQIVNPDSKYRSISLWRGRKIPVKIGDHVCWYFPIFHPSYVAHLRKFEPRDLDTYPSDEEFAFACDVQNAFDQVDTLPDAVIHSVDEAQADVELVDDINRVAELLDIVGADPTCGVDIETNCLRPYETNSKILSAAFSSRSATFSFAVDHPGATWTELERRQLDVLIKRFLYESQCRKIVHHLPFELEWFGYFFGTGCFYASVWEDSESQAYILDARRGGLSLDFLCLVTFGLNLKAISGLDRKNLDKVPVHQVLKYNGIDARYHRLLYIVQLKRIKAEKLKEIYEHQMRRLPALVLATMHGVPIDQGVVAGFEEKYGGRLKAALKEVENDIDAKAFAHKKGYAFNPLSPRDVNILLKEILQLDLASTSKGELEHVDYPIAQKIVDCREAQKVLSTYISPVSVNAEDNVLFPDGMIHPIISTTTVITWRTSSDTPNIQNWPKRDEERKEVRSQVRHKDVKKKNVEMRIVSFDYAGIQARNVAMESKDKVLVEAYWNNYDIHKTWMEKLNKAHPKWIPKSDLNDKDKMKAWRHLAKNKFVFPSFFGAQSYSISESLNIPRDTIEGVQEEFFDQFHDIAKWHKSLEKFYFKNGYVTGLSGFRRYAPVSANERINTPIQSDESVIVMDAMCRLSEMEDPRYQAMLMVHDDLTFCWPKAEIEKRAEVVVRELITLPFEWTRIVPIEVEMSVGEDWVHMQEVGKFANNSWNGIVELKK